MKEILRKYINSNQSNVKLSVGEVSIDEIIGEGGNGLVYSATILDEIIAIKFLTSNTTGNSLEQKRKRFLAEYFNVLKIIDSKGIVKYLNYDILKCNEDVEIPAILMKKYDGSLKQKKDSNSICGFMDIFNFLLDTVEKLHKHGIIHRDLKPENILVKGDEYVIADFGIAAYNPDIFKIRAETKSSERIGNRLFSAPEQEESGVEAHPTMDIYSIGQILQWYVTGKTHRGTGRVSISTFYNNCDDVEIYDSIIEKCLSNVPSDRFQSIEEIREYMSFCERKDYHDYFNLFHRILIRTFPKKENRTIFSDDKKRIEDLFLEIKKDLAKFNKMLWFTNGSQAGEVKLTHKIDNVWKFDDCQLNIDKVWINYDNSLFNDFILIHYVKGEPFTINGEKKYYTAIVDGVHHISYSEYESGYAEFENNIIDLNNHVVEFIEVPQKGGYLFICTKYHCAFIRENEKITRKFIEDAVFSGKDINNSDLMTLIQNIRKNKHIEVLGNL